MTDCPHHLKRILVRCTPAIKSAWPTAPDRYWETVAYKGNDEDWLILFLSPIGGWRRTNTHLDEEPKPLFSSSTALLQTSRVYRSWEGTVDGCRAELHGILEEIAISSTTSNQADTFTPVLIQDCATPESSDLRDAIANDTEPSTLRQGILMVPERGGLVQEASGIYYMPGGFKFAFQELEARIA